MSEHECYRESGQQNDAEAAQSAREEERTRQMTPGAWW
jgi:hypothetical protein